MHLILSMSEHCCDVKFQQLGRSRREACQIYQCYFIFLFFFMWFPKIIFLHTNALSLFLNSNNNHQIRHVIYEPHSDITCVLAERNQDNKWRSWICYCWHQDTVYMSLFKRLIRWLLESWCNDFQMKIVLHITLIMWWILFATSDHPDYLWPPRSLRLDSCMVFMTLVCSIFIIIFFYFRPPIVSILDYDQVCDLWFTLPDE